jgi:hypothetical protein
MKSATRSGTSRARREWRRAQRCVVRRAHHALSLPKGYRGPTGSATLRISVGSDARGRRFGTCAAEGCGFDQRGQLITIGESRYVNRRGRQDADAAGERYQGGIAPRAGVAHLACTIVVSRVVVHRTGLSGCDGLTALGQVARRRFLAAQRERRRRQTRELTREPGTNEPR